MRKLRQTKTPEILRIYNTMGKKHHTTITIIGWYEIRLKVQLKLSVRIRLVTAKDILIKKPVPQMLRIEQNTCLLFHNRQS